MKFINYLESITGVGIFPLISMLIFFIFFTVVFLYLLKADKKTIAGIKRIPLTNDDESCNNG